MILMINYMKFLPDIQFYQTLLGSFYAHIKVLYQKKLRMMKKETKIQCSKDLLSSK